MKGDEIMNKRNRISGLIATLVIIPLVLVICGTFITGCEPVQRVRKEDIGYINNEVESYTGKNLTYKEASEKMYEFGQDARNFHSEKGVDLYILTIDGHEIHDPWWPFDDRLDPSDEARYDITTLEKDNNDLYKGIKVVQVNEPSETSGIEETTSEVTTETFFDEQAAISDWLVFLEGTWDGEVPYSSEDLDGNEVHGTFSGSVDFKKLVERDIENGISVSIDAETGALVMSSGETDSFKSDGFTIYKIDKNTIKVKFSDKYVPNEYTYTRTQQ